MSRFAGDGQASAHAVRLRAFDTAGRITAAAVDGGMAVRFG